MRKRSILCEKVSKNTLVYWILRTKLQAQQESMDEVENVFTIRRLRDHQVLVDLDVHSTWDEFCQVNILGALGCSSPVNIELFLFFLFWNLFSRSIYWERWPRVANLFLGGYQHCSSPLSCLDLSIDEGWLWGDISHERRFSGRSTPLQRPRESQQEFLSISASSNSAQLSQDSFDDSLSQVSILSRIDNINFAMESQEIFLSQPMDISERAPDFSEQAMNYNWFKDRLFVGGPIFRTMRYYFQQNNRWALYIKSCGERKDHHCHSEYGHKGYHVQSSERQLPVAPLSDPES